MARCRSLLTPEQCVIHNVPDLEDVRTMVRILQSLGAKVQFDGQSITASAERVKDMADYDLVRKMRGSICVLGPLLGRLRRAKVSLPGGCVIGTRPIDLHLKGMEALGAKVKTAAGYVRATAKTFKGAEVFLGGRAGPTVLGTANLLMASVLAPGRTLI